MHIGYYWILVGLFSLLIEIGSPGLLFFAALSAGALSAGCVAFLTTNIFIQCTAGGTTSLAAFLVIKRYANRSNQMVPPTNIDALIGSTGIVVEEVSLHTAGLVKINGELWRATTTETQPIAPAATVVIQAVKGNTITVTAHS